MALPFFYISGYTEPQQTILLDEDTSRHIVQVLRMKEGKKINLTDGKGTLLTCKILAEHKKHCTVEVLETSNQQQATRKISIAISLLKNSSRFEWFLEKATEIGVSEIIPIVCERTEKEKFRYDRMNVICISAMLQSQQCWLPVLHEPVQFENILMRQFKSSQKFIAHCEDSSKQPISQFPNSQLQNSIILIGPEGDFTPKEIELALLYGFQPVSLGETRLRSETAGVVAAALLMS
ncbi:MAG: 16S rRNA (uracil(1498)-N(3))-methyltransferase [Sphingobacteriales bacterium]|nr:16S rRNA (uracil(1498)-N(3))-methyltransferase [Sphingobacteriales bacterium]